MDTSKEEIECEAYYKHSIQMALENKFSWTTLASVFDQMTPTLSQSKDLVKILLDVIQNLQKQYQELVQHESNVSNENDQFEGIEKQKKEPNLKPLNGFPIQDSVEAEFVEDTKEEIDQIEFVQIEDLHHDYKPNSEEQNASQIQNFNDNEFDIFVGIDDKDIESFAINALVIDKADSAEKLQGMKHENLVEGHESKSIKTPKEGLNSIIPKNEPRNEFECKICAKTFTKPSSLSNHVRIHRNKSHFIHLY